MKKVVVSEYISLDGVVEEPTWTRAYSSDDIAKFKYDELFSSDMLLLGRVTYEGFAQAWPTMQGTGDFGERMNSLPKYVASNSLNQMSWNATLIKGDIKAEVTKLKQGEGQNILVYGSGTFVNVLKQLDLIDEYRLLTYPVVLGKGKQLFTGGEQTTLKLARTQTFAAGVIALIYEPDRK